MLRYGPEVSSGVRFVCVYFLHKCYERLPEDSEASLRQDGLRLPAPEEFQRSRWLRSADVVPTIVALREHVGAVKDTELERAMAKLGHLEERDKKIVQALANGLANKILHPPTTALKERARVGDADQQILDHAHELFGLDKEDA